MFFKKQSEPRAEAERSRSTGEPGSPQLKAIDGGKAASVGASARPTPMRNRAIHGAPDDVSLGLVLDALGGILSSFARYPIELPDKSAEEVTSEIGAWQRHATLGYPIDTGAPGAAVGIRERDWSGLVRAVTAQRRDEHRHVTSSVSDLRDALWACVETVHKALHTDQSTDQTTDEQVVRVRTALQRMQTGSIKSEVLGAVAAIEGALQSRRDQQQERYVSLATKLDRLGRQLEEARRESTTDAMTGLGNRKLFDTMAPRAIQMFSLSRQPVVLLMADLDKLKLVNDMYGHQAGDVAIIGLAKALTKVFMRQSDVVCRIGGDEFAVLLTNTDWKVASSLARRLQEQIAELPTPHPSMEFKVGASVGVAQLESFEELDEWVSRADKALYKAKQNGRDRVCVADSLVTATG
ncbi:MAG: GGDEF domain-containing protein [Gemmatimonadota bacterium]